jgi:hypothetical protein
VFHPFHLTGLILSNEVIGAGLASINSFSDSYYPGTTDVGGNITLISAFLASGARLVVIDRTMKIKSQKLVADS